MKTYVVANPRGLPKGAWIIRNGEKRWYEGDVVTEKDFTKAGWQRWKSQGFVVEAAGG